MFFEIPFEMFFQIFYGHLFLTLGKTIIEPITITIPGRIMKRIIFHSLDINKASVS